MRSDDPSSRYQRYNSASRRERYIEGCVLFPIWIMIEVPFRLIRWLLRYPFGLLREYATLFGVVGVETYARLSRRLNPVKVRLTQEGMEEGYFAVIATSGWYCFENALEAEVRLCVGNGSGEIPRKLRGQGLLLQPGQKHKLYFPREDSSYDLELFGKGGRKLDRIKLRVSTRYYED
ncbi:hypothetical protein [Ktedonospora formicarum]|uniref:Uncharacterized protein n=1 Tax=Ktedonospora formicarum TaxID=2778364 RepID=A0A8J3ID94_9CHLR|nr:hypothetical protein [Ktedonospora formicarum]GHO51075.1 hypothetical protein KSX_92380 [Ktedonospora formicarum]